MVPSSGKKRKKGLEEGLFGSLVESVAKVIAPNSLQFIDQEFQLSSKNTQQAACEAAKLVQPGDLIFVTTSGFFYSMGRYLTNSPYDHVVVALDDENVLHVGPPHTTKLQLTRVLLPQRQPVIFRVSMTMQEREKFVRCLHQLIGYQYDIVRAYQLALRLTVRHLFKSSPLTRLPLDTQHDSWICSDAILILLTGCVSKFRETLVKAKQKQEPLDIFLYGSASLSDFIRLHHLDRKLLTRISLSPIHYTLVPHKRSLREHIPEFMTFLARISNGDMKWPLLEEVVFPHMKRFTKKVLSVQWAREKRVDIMIYVGVLTLLLKRGLTLSRILWRTAQLWLLRYLCHELYRILQDEANGRAKSQEAKL